MRVLARISCTLAGLALAAPVAAWADPPPTADPAAAPVKPHKHRRSLFGGERLCAECQRARAMALDGVNVPPPPAYPPGVVINGGDCATCGNPRPVLARGGSLTESPGAVAAPAAGTALAASAGHAAVSGESPGYAAVGSEPAPIGVVQPRVAAVAPARKPGAGPFDGAVAPSSYSPAPPQPPGVNRPHIIAHLLGISDMRHALHESMDRHLDDAHAAISYGPQEPTVTELPAKAVYGK
jgi:hypothetical protein